MGYNYSHENPDIVQRQRTGTMGYWRSTAQPGVVYKARDDSTGSRYFKGDLFICLFISGDCHYSWLRISKRVNNGHHIYYDTGEIVSGYGKDFEIAYPEMRPFNDHDLVHILASKQALINFNSTLTKEELEEVKKLRAGNEFRNKLFQKYGIVD